MWAKLNKSNKMPFDDDSYLLALNTDKDLKTTVNIERDIIDRVFVFPSSVINGSINSAIADTASIKS